MAPESSLMLPVGGKCFASFLTFRKQGGSRAEPISVSRS